MKYTEAPLEVGIIDPAKDREQFIKDMLSHGKGDVFMVLAPKHPKTIGESPHYEHAAITALTGNGPDSEGNAVLYSTAPAMRDLLRKLQQWDDGMGNMNEGLTVELRQAIDDILAVK